MNDFADFSQVDTQPSNNADAFGAFGDGVQMAPQEDAFADAGLPSMSSGFDSQAAFSGPPAPAEDYTDEELQLLKKVEEENEDRKRKLYEKMQEESEKKRERKAAAQLKLQEWKSERDATTAGKKMTNQQEAAMKQ